MKSSAIVLVMFSLLILSCKKESVDTSEAMSCKIDGTDWISSESFAEVALSTSVTGTDAQKLKSIDLTIEEITKGDYPISDYTYVRYRDNLTLYEAVPGTGKISITEITDKTVSGNFNFTVKQPGKINSEKVITNGVFKNIIIEQ